MLSKIRPRPLLHPERHEVLGDGLLVLPRHHDARHALRVHAAVGGHVVLELPDAEQRCNEGIQSALSQWTSLPSLDIGSHTPLLQVFQQFQELQESAQMLLEISNAQRNNQPPELSSILTTWRERLPNRWEV